METGTYTSNNTVLPSGKELLANIRKVAEGLYDGPPLIKVWVGPDDFLPRTDYPVIRESSFLAEDDCYVIAGMGVVAGKKANKRLWDIGYLAVWDENPQN